MTESKGGFTADERRVLHDLAEMFEDRDSRNQLQKLLDQGTTISELVFAYKMNRRVISTLKALGGLVVLAGGTVAALRGLNLWPWR